MSKSLLNRSIMIGLVSLVLCGVIAFPQTIKAESKDNSCPARGVPPVAVKVIKMTVTAYSSTPDQTDDTPFITASQKHVADGIIAINGLKFGTKVRIPALFGDKVFTVEDRMNARYGQLKRADIWVTSREHAKQFGVKVSDIEIVES